MELETKHASAQVKSADPDTGKATFVVSVFNTIDAGGDIVTKGAFADTLKDRVPKFVADHKWEVTHKLGKIAAARETDEGLEVDVQFNLDKQISREVFSDFLFDPDGAEFSFGYEVSDGGAEFKEGIRYLNKVDLYEVGPVLIGMHPATRLVGAKSDTMTDASGAVWKLVSETSDAETPAPEPEPEPDPAFDGLNERVGAVEAALAEVLAR